MVRTNLNKDYFKMIYSFVVKYILWLFCSARNTISVFLLIEIGSEIKKLRVEAFFYQTACIAGVFFLIFTQCKWTFCVNLTFINSGVSACK
jgi:hypothetical protein